MSEGRQTIGRFGSYGLFGGALVGAIAGIMLAGPTIHDSDTPLNDLAVIILGCSAVGALIGSIALFLAFPAPPDPTIETGENGGKFGSEANAQESARALMSTDDATVDSAID